MPADPVMGHRWGWDRWALLALLLVALAVRVEPVLQNRFHSDEALYGYWGLLIANWRDPGLVGVPVYKPPLLPYAVAAAQGILGDSEFSVRMPGLVSGLLLVPLAAALARTLYRDNHAALAAAICVAFSPFAILFSATAFTDLPMMALGLMACVAAARGKPLWAGLLAGLSFASKQPGLAWLPLIIALQYLNLDVPRVKPLLLIVGSWLSVTGLVAAWNLWRVAQGAEGFWGLGVSGYGGLRFIWPQELGARLSGWIDLSGYLFVSPVVNGLLLTGLPVLVERAFVTAHGTRRALVDLLLVSFVLAYGLLHWLWAFPIWDRYLLPLLPILAILAGRILALLASWLGRVAGRQSPVVGRLSTVVCHVLMVAFLVSPAWAAALSQYPVGGDHGAYDGIDKVADYLNGLPEGTVVYQHWLGWEYDYYLFGGPISIAYWPTPAWLAGDVQAFGARSPRYVAFPSWESSVRVEQALAEVGFELGPVLTTTRRDGHVSFVVYRIQPLSQ